MDNTSKQSTMVNSKPWAYSPQQVADNLGLSINTVYVLIKDKRLHSVKVNRRILIPSGSVDTFLQCGAK